MLKRLTIYTVFVLSILMILCYGAYAKWDKSRMSDPADMEGHLKSIFF
ncbi:hypothetical protein GF312_04845, partial [Candidatus Poribacteria bacterium]|nr:hypothetical protein [Candidatus Poribacteria bacterium]